MVSIEEIRRALSAHTPNVTSAVSARNSSVALVLRPREDGPEALYILRARHEKDPWSGNIGFPGGRLERGETERQAAERETAEELGIDLGQGELLGRLDDIVGAHIPVIVSCFVYTAPDPAVITVSDEVDHAFWVPFASLLDPERHCCTEVLFRGEPFLRPAITLLPPGYPVLWGITYRLTTQLLRLVGHHLQEDPD